MESVSLAWKNAVGRHRGVWFVDIIVRGAGQVMFQNNPLTGLLFLVGIFWGAVAAGQITIGVGAVVALLISTGAALALHADRAALDQGLFGFNGALVGVAVPIIVQDTPLMWVYLALGAALSTVVMLAFTSMLRTWRLPALTFPFVLTTWLLALAVYPFARLTSGSLGPPALPLAGGAPGAHVALTASFLLAGWITGVAQVFLLNNVVTGIIFVVALAVNSWRAALLALAGAAVGLLVALLFGASAHSIGAGLYGFSAALTAIALGSVFYTLSYKLALYAIAGAVVTVIVQAALNTALAPLGIPTFTAPFVLATWLFLLPELPFAARTA